MPGFSVPTFRLGFSCTPAIPGHTVLHRRNTIPLPSPRRPYKPPGGGPRVLLPHASSSSSRCYLAPAIATVPLELPRALTLHPARAGHALDARHLLHCRRGIGLLPRDCSPPSLSSPTPLSSSSHGCSQ